VGVLEHRFMRAPDLKEAGDISGPSELSRGSVPPTYVPMRNAIYYSLAAAYAEERGAGCIIGGHNLDDKRLFEDTSEDFFAHLQRALSAGSPRLREHGLKILRPLRERRKAEVIMLAAEIGVPLELTWSCHRSAEQHCWRCPGCRARMDAFAAARIDDPLMPKKV
jgi:7-cyano-7-deazaguanine synthase